MVSIALEEGQRGRIAKSISLKTFHIFTFKVEPGVFTPLQTVNKSICCGDWVTGELNPQVGPLVHASAVEQ